MKNKYLILIVLCFLLAACGGDSGRAVEARPVDPVPSLVGFDIIDSYGVDTGVSNQALEIDPYVDGGLFDVLWRVNSLEDYRINVRVNSIADTYNSTLIYTDVCGEGLSCDQGGNLICEYTTDYYLSCGNSQHLIDVASLIKRVPQKLFLIFEVCDLDSSYCSYQYYPVSML